MNVDIFFAGLVAVIAFFISFFGVFPIAGICLGVIILSTTSKFEKDISKKKKILISIFNIFAIFSCIVSAGQLIF